MTVRTRAFSRAGGVLALCAVLAACSQPAPQAPSPSPSPVPSKVASTPIETQLEKQQRLDFAAAEKSYRTFRSEYTRVAVSGGSERATPVMSENAAGPYLKVMSGFLAATRAEGKRQQGQVVIAYVKHGGYSPENLTLNVCEDGRKVKNVTKKGGVSYGAAARLSLYLRKIDGRWKVWNGDDKRVATCAD